MNTMNYDSDDEQIVPDVPVMRSVALMTSAAPSLVTSAPIALKSTQTSASKIAPIATTTTSTAHEDSSWKLGKLQPLPFMYMLERSHVYINNEPELIAKRIVDILRNHSVSAKFVRGENMAEAVTCDNVHFVVRLWEGEGKVLVEVQRLSGCGFQFHHIARAVLIAAKGAQSPKPRPAFKIPSSIPRVSIEETKECLKEELEIAASMLKSPKVDSHMLALESLVQLTSSSNYCFQAANYILSSDLLTALLSFIESTTTKDMPQGLQRERAEVLHRYALTVLANCLVALQETGELSQAIQQQNSLVSKQLFTILLDDVSAACQCPHAATQAIRCLQPLVTFHRQTMDEQKTWELVSIAEQFGKQRHDQLEKECRKLAELCRSSAQCISVHM